MDIKKMLEAQKELDKANMKKGGLTEYPLDMAQTAYRVELGELLQEWKQFKYWKLNKGEIDREKMLEEWADCMHFALSLENYNICPNEGYYDYISKHAEEDIEKYLYAENDIYIVLKRCFTDFDYIVEYTIILGLKLGFTMEELEQAYWNKNKINWDRIKNKY